jgi:hypothetical protein
MLITSTLRNFHAQQYFPYSWNRKTVNTAQSDPFIVWAANTFCLSFIGYGQFMNVITRKFLADILMRALLRYYVTFEFSRKCRFDADFCLLCFNVAKNTFNRIKMTSTFFSWEYDREKLWDEKYSWFTFERLHALQEKVIFDLLTIDWLSAWLLHGASTQ